jgi:hypothetical protein
MRICCARSRSVHSRRGVLHAAIGVMHQARRGLPPGPCATPAVLTRLPACAPAPSPITFREKASKITARSTNSISNQKYSMPPLPHRGLTHCTLVVWFCNEYCCSGAGEAVVPVVVPLDASAMRSTPFRKCAGAKWAYRSPSRCVLCPSNSTSVRSDTPIMPTTYARSGWRGAGRVESRHNQSASRKANSLSSGRYRAGLTPSGAVRESAFSFNRMSAWRY